MLQMSPSSTCSSQLSLHEMLSGTMQVNAKLRRLEERIAAVPQTFAAAPSPCSVAKPQGFQVLQPRHSRAQVAALRVAGQQHEVLDPSRADKAAQAANVGT